MQSLLLLTKKNLKLLLRAKGSALVIIFAPLLLILFLGLAYSTGTQLGLHLGVHAPSFSDDVTSFITLLENDGYTISKFETSIDPCIEEIKKGDIHSCIVLPESLKVEGNTQKEVKFYVDPSRVNLVWAVQQAVESKFNFKSQEISEGLTNNIFSTLATTKSGVATQKKSIVSIKEKGNGAASSNEDVQKTLKSLDLEAPSTNPKIANLTGDVANIKDKISDARGALSTSTTIDPIEKSEIDDLLSAAELELKAAGVKELQAELKATKEKFSIVASAIRTSSTKLDSSTENIQNTVKALNDVETSLTGIIEKLDAQKVTDSGVVSSPLVSTIEQVGAQASFLNYLFPAILVLVIMFSSLLLGTTLVMMEKNSPAFLRNFFLPISKGTFIASTYLTTLIMIVVEVVIILAISLFFLEEVLATLPSVALVLFIAASVFAFLGMGVGYLFTSEETGVLGSISLGSLFLFLSGVLLPLEGLPVWLQEINQFNPFVIAEKLVREIFIFSTPLIDVLPELGIILGYAVLLFLLIWFLESLVHKHLVHRFMKNHHRAHRQKDKLKKNDA
ncbi:ABC transporter permease [Candidatus Woesearchaeota archaeon]|jgi:ABC-type multidrug transport system permease subunit|nr:ABC transporter permease [Candidatus Woesearchaeota archaeon]MBT4247054.1 ABC transporter permease [Candidatus Woesearchaeota archaeon]MBT4433586.1 ABC transporter permease [Candidatus Woesearchaeota archaeon]MBT7332562.1 ABC transporter permease [Candidatus Woesearchaeota archaeon]